jgi:hypothetical protein
MSPPTHACGAGSLEQELHSQRIRESRGRGSVSRGGAPVTATDAEGSGASEASRRQEAQWRRSGGGAEAERRRSGGGAEAERRRSGGAATAQALATPPSNRFSHSTLRFALVHASCEIKRAFARTPRVREARRRRLLLCCLRLFERTNGGHDGRTRAGLAACTRRSRSGRNPPCLRRGCCVVFLSLASWK